MSGHGQGGRATNHDLGIHAVVKVRYGAYLPHWTEDDAVYAVCFRLCDSLPRQAIEDWKFERKRAIMDIQQKNQPADARQEARLAALFSEKVEKYLDEGRGECWLRRDGVAEIAAAALKHFDGTRYWLIA